MTNTLETAIVMPVAGTIGIGVGEFYAPIAERGETTPVFTSKVWFPSEAKDEAYEFAREAGMFAVENIAL